VLSMMLPQVNEFHGLAHCSDNAFGDCIRVPGHRNNTAVVGGIHFTVEERHPGRAGQSGRKRINNLFSPAFAEVGNALYDLFQGCSNRLMTTFPFLIVTTQ